MFHADVALSVRVGSTLAPDRTAGKEMKSNPPTFFEVILACKIALCFNRSLPGMQSEEALELI